MTQHSSCVNTWLNSLCGTQEAVFQSKPPCTSPPPSGVWWGCRSSGGGQRKSQISLGDHLFAIEIPLCDVTQHPPEVLRQVTEGVFVPEDLSKSVLKVACRGIGNMRVISCKCGCVIAPPLVMKITTPEAYVLFWHNLFNVLQVSPTEKEHLLCLSCWLEKRKTVRFFRVIQVI